MNQDELIVTAIYAGLFLLLFSLGEFLYHKLKISVEISRKFVHLGTGFICLTFPFYISSHWSVFVLTISFILILVVSMKLDLLKSINAVKRKTNGSFLFPIVIYITYWSYSIFGLNDWDGTDVTLINYQSLDAVLSNQAAVFYLLPLLILSISDPLAALIGKNFPIREFSVFGHTKSVAGCGSFFLSSLLLSLIFTLFLYEQGTSALLLAFCIAIMTTLVEAISQKGFDNLLIPVAAIAVLILFSL